jgi:hypothetical protein
MSGRSSRAPNPSARAAARRGAGAARRGLLLAAALLGLAGCTETGDLGRPRPTVLSEAILPAAGGAAAVLRGEPVSPFDLTDDEDELRRRAWRFLMPAHERSVFERQVAALVQARVLPVSARPADPRAYGAALSADPARSPVSRYRRLAGDVAADRALLAPLARVAARVIEADARRLQAVPLMSDVEARRLAGALARVAENRCLVAWTRTALDERIAGYALALERVFLETPDREAIPPERALAALRAEAALLDALPVPGLDEGGCAPPETIAAAPPPPPPAMPRRREVLGK